MKLILETYLRYLDEATKWKEKVASGQLSGKGIQKLRQAGTVKPWAQYKAGLEKGTKNIMKRAGAKETGRLNLFGQAANVIGPITHASLIRKKPKISMPTSPEKFRGIMRGAGFKAKKRQIGGFGTLAKRHEADEAIAVKRQREKFGKAGMGALHVTTPKGEAPGHASMSVLKKEKKYAPFAAKVYGQGKALQKVRKSTGEYKVASSLSKGAVRRMDKAASKKRVEASEEAKKQVLTNVGLKGKDKLKHLAKTLRHPLKSALGALGTMKTAKVANITRKTESLTLDQIISKTLSKLFEKESK